MEKPLMLSRGRVSSAMRARRQKNSHKKQQKACDPDPIEMPSKSITIYVLATPRATCGLCLVCLPCPFACGGLFADCHQTLDDVVVAAHVGHGRLGYCLGSADDLYIRLRTTKLITHVIPNQRTALTPKTTKIEMALIRSIRWSSPSSSNSERCPLTSSSNSEYLSGMFAIFAFLSALSHPPAQ
jgi:hypothetical protein